MISIKQAFENWENEIKPLVIEQYGEEDNPALAESWNNYTDSLCTDGEIYEWQYMNAPAFDDPMPGPEEEFEERLKELGISSEKFDDLFNFYLDQV